MQAFRWVLPTPGGPRKITLFLSDKGRIEEGHHALTIQLGLKGKIKLVDVLDPDEYLTPIGPFLRKSSLDGLKSSFELWVEFDAYYLMNRSVIFDLERIFHFNFVMFSV